MQPLSAIAPRRRLSFALLGLLLGSGCSPTAANEPDTRDILASNDFDHLDGWTGETPSLTRAQAHSGAYSLVVKPGIPYSLGYSNPLGRLSEARPHRLRFDAWVLRSSPLSKSFLVVELKDPATGARIIWEGIDLSQQAPKLGEWQRIRHLVNVPATVSAAFRIGVYMWGADASQPTYLDDLTISRVPE
jgi:hypothetical protein